MCYFENVIKKNKKISIVEALIKYLKINKMTDESRINQQLDDSWKAPSFRQSVVNKMYK